MNTQILWSSAQHWSRFYNKNKILKKILACIGILELYLPNILEIMFILFCHLEYTFRKVGKHYVNLLRWPERVNYLFKVTN